MADRKQTRERIALGVLLVVAALVWFLYARPNAVVNDSPGAGPYTPINAQDFGVVLLGLERAQSTEYKSNGRNIFVAGAVPVETGAAGPAKSIKPPHLPSGPRPEPPPSPPALPPSMKFYGYGTEPGHGERCAFLLEGEDLRIFKEGDSFAGHLRVTKIGNDRLEFEDTNTGLHGFATLEMPAPAA